MDRKFHLALIKITKFYLALIQFTNGVLQIEYNVLDIGSLGATVAQQV
jgi:hypothetical protein